MKIRSFSAQLVSGLLLAAATLGLTACGNVIYKFEQNNYSGRPTPPSGLQQRVMASLTTNGSSGGLQILDGLRDIRTNVQNTIPGFTISGFSAAQPTTILNFPEQTRGYVLSYTDGSLIGVNYSTEASLGAIASFGAYSSSVAASPDGTRFAGANESVGIVTVIGTAGSIGAGTYSLNLPNVFKVVINQGNSVVLAMVRNSNTLYRIVKLPASTTPVIPPGSVDCEPLLLPVYCVVPVKGSFDRPVDAYFSTDGTTAYVLNCGPECGGATASVAALQVAPLNITNVPTGVSPIDPTAPTTLQTLPVANPIPVPGGVTVATSDGTNLFLAGQQLQADGLFAGNLSVLNLSSYLVTSKVSIADGTHTRMLMVNEPSDPNDPETVWIGAQQCANGERAKTGQNYNCLTRVAVHATPTVQVLPNVTPGGTTTVPYPNDNQNPYYYGNLTGLCWVQNYQKVYTAYGGQIHAFYTTSGQELDNTNIKLQGTVLDVAYIDALTNAAN